MYLEDIENVNYNVFETINIIHYACMTHLLNYMGVGRKISTSNRRKIEPASASPGKWWITILDG